MKTRKGWRLVSWVIDSIDRDEIVKELEKQSKQIKIIEAKKHKMSAWQIWIKEKI